MVDINKMVDGYFDSHGLNFDNFLELIQEQMKTLGEDIGQKKGGTPRPEAPQTLSWSSIPEIPVSEIGWSQLSTTEEGAEIPGEQRAQLKNFLDQIEGDDLPAKLASLNQFYGGGDFDQMIDGEAGATISRVMSYLVFYKTLTTIITNFNASSAGFAFESFLGVLLGGQQVPTGEGTIADLTTADGTPISLKLYSETGVEVGGSYTDLINDLTNERGSMQYVVVTKTLTGDGLEKRGHLDFYRFNFNLSNVVSIFALSNVAQNARLLELPIEFIKNSTIDYNESLPAIAAGISPEELETMFSDGVKNFIGDEQKAEVLLQTLDWANRTELFKSGKKGRIPGRSPFLNKALRNVVENLVVLEKGQEGIFTPEEFPKVIEALNMINNQIIDYRRSAGARRKESLSNLEFASAEKSFKFYQATAERDADELKRALRNSRGYLFKDDFKLNKTNVKQIASYSESALPEGQDSVDIGTIHIGVANIQDILNKVTATVNAKVFEIFNNVKVLTTNIQAYFAGGLTEDNQADTAIGAAQNIETKTEEIKSEK